MKKRFIFDENYIKRYAKKNQTRALVIGASLLIIIIIVIIVMLANRKQANRPVDPSLPKYEVKRELVIESGSLLPEPVDYFNVLENIDLDSIKVTYPEEFEITYNASSCTDEELLEIDEDNSNIDEFSCVSKTLVTPRTYGITVTVGDEEYTVNLIIEDTTYPVVLTNEVEIFKGETYDIADFTNICYDTSGECILNYAEELDEDGNIIDYSKFTEVGEYTIKIIATDKYGNQTDPIEVKLTIKELDTNVYTVTFNSNGGTTINNILVEEGQTIAEPSAPTKDNNIFEGWYNGDNKFDFNTPITSNITLTAKWQSSTSNNQPSTISVTSVSLNFKTIYLEVGESKTVQATVSPSNATNKTVTWNSANANIASVDNGKITGIAAGTTTISATSNGKSGSVTIIVRETGSSSCAYGDANYNTSKYILSVNLSSNNCAINPNITHNETVSVSDYQKLVTDLSNMGISISRNFDYKTNYISVKNNSGIGLVGYQITVYVSVVDNYQYMSAEYIIKPDGSRQFIKNNIIKNNISLN